MRGIDHQQSHMFSYLSPEARVRKDHPLPAMRAMVDEVLVGTVPAVWPHVRPRSCCGRSCYRCGTRSAASGC